MYRETSCLVIRHSCGCSIDSLVSPSTMIDKGILGRCHYLLMPRDKRSTAAVLDTYRGIMRNRVKFHLVLHLKLQPLASIGVAWETFSVKLVTSSIFIWEEIVFLTGFPSVGLGLLGEKTLCAVAHTPPPHCLCST